MRTSIWFWIAFHIGVFLALIVDLVSFKRRDRELSLQAAARRSAIWIVLSLDVQPARLETARAG